MGYFYPCGHQTHLECLLLKSIFLFIFYDHRSQSHLKFQSCLKTEYAGVCFWMSYEFFFLETFPNNMWWCRCCLKNKKVFWPQDSAIFCNSPAIVLGESLATQIILLTMHQDDIDTRPLPGRFIIFSVDWKFFIIALVVEIGIFTALAIYLKPLH